MNDKPASPFAGLDKALLRTTRPAQPTVTESLTEPLPVSVTAPTTKPPARPRRSSTRESTSQQQSHALASTTASPLASSVTRQQANDHAGIDPGLVDSIRKVVKTPGKEVSFVRLTPAEKGRLGDIVYTYKRQGVKTSENEINRIAVNYMLADYEAHGDASVLARVIAALLA